MAVELAERAQAGQFNRPERNFLQTRPFNVEQDDVVSSFGTRAPETQTQRDLREISVLQTQFDKVLGRKYDREDMLQRSYNPVIDRWRVEKLRGEKDKVGEDAYVKEIRTNLETNLKERMQVGDNVIRYRIEGDQLYSEHFPAEPFGRVLQRGAEYRLQHGTPEPEREGSVGERAGWEIIRAKMADPETPIGTKMTSFSPKGRVEGSSYDRNIVDEYELVNDKDGRSVKLIRRMVEFDEADYYSAALALDPHFFDEYDGRPIDAWMLSHPVEGSLPNLAERQKGMSSKTFDRVYESGMLQQIEERYVDEITKEKVDWKQVALAFNAYYNQADIEEKRVRGGVKEQSIYLSQRSVDETINSLGWKKPDEKGGAGCPTSKGFSMTNGSLFGTYGNSVSWFAGGGGGSSESDEKGSLNFKCSKGHENKRPKGELIPNCTTCGESVAC